MTIASFSHTASVRSNPTELWSRLQVATTWEAIDGVDEVTGADVIDGELKSFRFSAQVGSRHYPGQAVVVSSAPPRQMELTVDNPEISGLITVELSPMPDGQVDVGFSMTVSPKSFVSRLAFPMITGAIGSGYSRSVDRFVQKLVS